MYVFFIARSFIDSRFSIPITRIRMYECPYTIHVSACQWIDYTMFGIMFSFNACTVTEKLVINSNSCAKKKNQRIRFHVIERNNRQMLCIGTLKVVCSFLSVPRIKRLHVCVYEFNAWCKTHSSDSNVTQLFFWQRAERKNAW